jgi:transposase-like protein
MNHQEEKTRLLKELESSGLTVSEFSRERGIPASRLYGLTRRGRARRSEGSFVRISPPRERVQLVISEKLRVEIPINHLREVITALGVTI